MENEDCMQVEDVTEEQPAKPVVDYRVHGTVPDLVRDGSQDYYQPLIADPERNDPLRTRTLKYMVDEFRQKDPCALLPEILLLDPQRRTYFMLNKLTGSTLDTDDPRLPKEADFDEHPDTRQFFECSGVFRVGADAPETSRWHLAHYIAPKNFDKVDLQIQSANPVIARGTRLHIHPKLLVQDKITSELINCAPYRFFVSSPPHIQVLGIYYTEPDSVLQIDRLYEYRQMILNGLQKGVFEHLRFPPEDAATAKTDVFRECKHMHGKNRAVLQRIVQSLDAVVLEQYFEDTVVLHPKTHKPLDESTRDPFEEDSVTQQQRQMDAKMAEELLKRTYGPSMQPSAAGYTEFTERRSRSTSNPEQDDATPMAEAAPADDQSTKRQRRYFTRSQRKQTMMGQSVEQMADQMQEEEEGEFKNT